MPNLKLTKKNYPTLLAAFKIVAHDVDLSGPYLIPNQYLSRLQRMENVLAKLNPETLETFCIGELQEQEEIIEAYPPLAEVNDLINVHFGF